MCATTNIIAPKMWHNGRMFYTSKCHFPRINVLIWAHKKTIESNFQSVNKWQWQRQAHLFSAMKWAYTRTHFWQLFLLFSVKIGVYVFGIYALEIWLFGLRMPKTACSTNFSYPPLPLPPIHHSCLVSSIHFDSSFGKSVLSFSLLRFFFSSHRRKWQYILNMSCFLGGVGCVYYSFIGICSTYSTTQQYSTLYG